MKRIGSVLLFSLFLVVLAALNLLVHELGHCFTIDATGGKCDAIYVLPGIKVWPLADFGERYPDTWDNYMGATLYSRGAPTEQTRGLVSLMGSGSVAALSLLALLALYIFRPAGWLRFPLLAQSLMFLDLLLYTILPHWFGLRHFFVVGGTTPEPLNGAVRMGIPADVFIAGVLIFSGSMLAGWIVYLWKSTKRRL